MNEHECGTVTEEECHVVYDTVHEEQCYDVAEQECHEVPSQVSKLVANTSPSLSTKLIKQEHLVRCVSITHVRVDVSQNFQLVPDDRNV